MSETPETYDHADDGADRRPIDRLLDVMKQLRDPDTGCPWDVKQDFASIAPYTLEEAHEVADAIARGDMEDLRDELGDLLLQVVFHAQMASEAGLFDFEDVARAISEKMVRRHPHVFGDVVADDGEAVRLSWEASKAQEKQARAARRGAQGDGDTSPSQLDDVPRGMPSLIYAQKIGWKAAKSGFDWPERSGVWDKLNEEIGELQAVLDVSLSHEHIDKERASDELGDCLFALVNLARHLDVDADSALRGTNIKFVRRFTSMERAAAQRGESLENMELAELEELWLEAKAREATGHPM